jgi:hypothetical protein
MLRTCWKTAVSLYCSCGLSCAGDGAASTNCSGDNSSSSGCSRLVPDEDDSSMCWGSAVTNGERSGSFPTLDLGICTEITGVGVCSTGDSSSAGRAGGRVGIGEW